MQQIDKSQLESLVTSTCPSFEHSGDYKSWLGTKEPECEPQYYILAGGFASHVLSNFDLFSKSDEMEKIFALIEKLHVDGDDYVRNWATVGFLEGLQSHIGNKKQQVEMYPRCEKYLGPESKFWWDELELFWKKEIPYLGASRASSK